MLRLKKGNERVRYDEAADFIFKQSTHFDPKMATFAQKAFSEGWIEAEDRLGKRPGGGCTSFPVKKNRVFL